MTSTARVVPLTADGAPAPDVGSWAGVRFSVPQLPPNLVHRPRLVTALDAAVKRHGVTLVTAGPGYGKTVLLSDWALRRTPPPAWLALTRADNDSRAFWPHVLHAVAQSHPAGFASTDWMGLSTSATPDRLFDDRAWRNDTEPVVLVLDDAHVLTDPGILEGLDRLVRRATHRVRLVLVARSIPLLPIHQYRLSGELHELRTVDLAMTSGEARELIDTHAVRLSDGDLTLLGTRTEGWPAGLRLAALRMQGSDDPSAFVAEMAMDSGSIGEYLVAEVLSVVPPEVRRLLVLTSLLDTVTGEAAEAVTGMEGCEETLAELARTNSLVVPLDAANTAFRYHPLLREVLQYLARREPARSRLEANRRAAEWFRERGDISSALRWALTGGDNRRVSSVLARGLVSAFLHDHVADDGMVRVELPPPAPDATPQELDELDCARLVLLSLSAGPDVARAELERRGEHRASAAPTTLGDGSAPAAEGGGQADVAAVLPLLDPLVELNRQLALVLLSARGGWAEQADRRITTMLDRPLHSQVVGVSGLRSKLLLYRARMCFVAGQVGRVPALLDEALAEAPVDEAAEVHVEVLAVQALTGVYSGRVRPVTDLVARAEVVLRVHGHLPRPVTLELAVAGGAYSRADLPAMAVAVSRAVAAGPRYSDPDLGAAVAYFQGLLLSASGRYDEATVCLTGPAFDLPGPSLLTLLRDTELAQIDLALGRAQDAVDRLAGYAATPMAITAALVSAQAYLALGNTARAEALSRVVRTQPHPQVGRAVAVRAMIVEAQLALGRDDEPGALRHLERARHLAGEDIVMPFVHATPAFGATLRRHPSLAEAWPMPAQVRPAPLMSVSPRLPPPQALTEREKAVLRLLTTTMPAAEVAEELYLSINTVKTHLAAIYRKLGVSRRRDAVARARELELL